MPGHKNLRRQFHPKGAHHRSPIAQTARLESGQSAVFGDPIAYLCEGLYSFAAVYNRGMTTPAEADVAAKLPPVLLKPGEADRLIAGHPWVYQGNILRLTAPAEDGAVVQVKDHRQRLIGVGLYNSKSKINVRLLDTDRTDIDESFFEERIRQALALRAKHLPGATSFRVINAESDFLSGLIVDKYEDVLVLQTSSLGMDQRKAEIVNVLRRVLAPRAIIERSE